MVRGIERSKLFRTRKDYEDLIRRFEDAFTGGKTVVYAWALMPNHTYTSLSAQALSPYPA
jgi:hypothetical protein